MIEEEGDRVALTGQEIDEVKVSHLGTSQYSPASYSFYYGVRCNVEGLEKQVKARMKIKSKGLIRRELVDIEWKGGELADELNRDNELKKRLLQHVRESKEWRGPWPVEIFPDKKTGIVWITTTKYVSPFPKSATPFQLPNDLTPSETSLKLYNAIARVIRKRVSPRVTYSQTD
jgi:hypothetical protein